MRSRRRTEGCEAVGPGGCQRAAPCIEILLRDRQRNDVQRFSGKLVHIRARANLPTSAAVVAFHPSNSHQRASGCPVMRSVIVFLFKKTTHRPEALEGRYRRSFTELASLLADQA